MFASSPLLPVLCVFESSASAVLSAASKGILVGVNEGAEESEEKAGVKKKFRQNEELQLTLK